MNDLSAPTCACGCGEYVKWNADRKRWNTYMKGHSRVKRAHAPPLGACGCGDPVVRKGNKWNTYIHCHHRRGKPYTTEQIAARVRSRCGREPIFSPFLEGVMVSFDQRRKRWTCVVGTNSNRRCVLHAHAVYEHHCGPVPPGQHVHHRDGRHETLHDDRPDNLTLLLAEWNLKIMPMLAKGFGVGQDMVTEMYLRLVGSVPNDLLFKEVVRALLANDDGEHHR